jgi:hypothetical protein
MSPIATSDTGTNTVVLQTDQHAASCGGQCTDKVMTKDPRLSPMQRGAMLYDRPMCAAILDARKQPRSVYLVTLPNAFTLMRHVLCWPSTALPGKRSAEVHPDGDTASPLHDGHAFVIFGGSR